LKANLCRVPTGGADLYNLKDAFSRAGYRIPRGFEAADPRLRELLVSAIGMQDIVVVLWSKHHSFRYWTAVERTTAVAMCKPVAFLLVDDTPLTDDLRPAIGCGRIPVITLADYLMNPGVLVRTLNTLQESKTASGITHEITFDSLVNAEFVKLQYTVFGDLEVSRFPLTNAQIERHWPEHSAKRCNASSADDEPAVLINWEETQHFCQMLSSLSPDHDYGLPTEVEWELAGRAGNTTCCGFDTSMLDLERNRTAPVGTAQQNAWGIGDFVGNVAQWTCDPSRWQETNGWYRPAIPVVIDERMSDYHTVKGFYFGCRTKLSWSLSESFANPSLLREEVLGIRLIRVARQRLHAGSVLK
jgi:hypothetical protein